MSEPMFLLLWFGVPAALVSSCPVGAGKNPLLWGVLSGVFPFFLVVLHMQYKPVDRKEKPPTTD